MTELELYKFVTRNELEYHWTKKDRGLVDDVILFIPHYLIEQWSRLLGTSIMDDEGLPCVMKDTYVCFYMDDICDYFGIELINIFKQE
jgi:hypothetical protein